MTERNHCVVSWGLQHTERRLLLAKKTLKQPQDNPQTLSDNLFLSPRL